MTTLASFTNAASGNLSVTNSSSLSTTGTVSSAGNLALTTTAGDLNVGGLLSAIGQVQLSAAGNVSVAGTVTAANADGSGGTVAISGNAASGTVNVTGTVDASAVTPSAVGGAVSLSAATVNLASGGSLKATGGSKGGTVTLAAGSSVADSGTINVSGGTGGTGGSGTAGGTTGSGGSANLTAPAIALTRATIDATGGSGGGVIVVGNKASSAVALDAATTLDASATAAGAGGQVSVISGGTSDLAGRIAARGGPQGGDGGVVETSGATLGVAGLTVDTTAPVGKTGTWLLDPFDLTVVASGGTPITPSPPGTFTSGAGGSTVLNTTIVSDLASTNVILQTSGSSGDGHGNGDIIVNAPIVWTNGNSLTLNAFANIDVNANITHSGTAVTLALNPNTGAAGGGLVVSSGKEVTLGVSDTLTISGNTYTLVTATAGLSAISSAPTGHYALDADFTLGSFTPITSLAASGAFEGLGHVLSGATISGTTDVGLFATNAGSINDLRLSGMNVSGTTDVGAMVGSNTGTVSNSSATSGTVSGSTNVGGLVGQSSGSISASFASASVSVGANGSGVGGLVGFNISGGSVSNSSAAGSVSGGSGSSLIGGLVGYNDGIVSASSAIGSVTGSSGSYDIGGLVGLNDVIGTVSNSSASGTVGGVAAIYGYYNIGGLVGLNNGSVSNGTASGPVDGGPGGWNIGGLVGQNAGGTVNNGSASGNVSGEGASYNIGGLVGYNLTGAEGGGGTVSNGSASGSVTGGSSSYNIGGLVGLNQGGTVSYGSAGGGLVSGGSGSYNIGGLVGENESFSFVSGTSTDPPGIVSNGTASGPVTGAAVSHDIGGLVGLNSGTVSASSALGSVSGLGASFNIGGLVGLNSGTVSASFATGSVTGGNGSSNIGGLVGYNDTVVSVSAGGGLITASGASGSVTAGNSSSRVGGLVGWNASGDTISMSCYDCIVISGGSLSQGLGAVTGGEGGNYIGGLVGENDGQVVNSYSLGAVNATAPHNGVGGLVGYNPGTVTTSYAAGPVNATGSDVGGLTGGGSPFLTVASFWDTATSGQATDADPNSKGKSTADMMTEATFLAAGWNFSGVWTIGADGNSTYPYFGVASTGAGSPPVSPPPVTVPPVSPPPPPLGGTSPPPPPGTTPETPPPPSTLDTGLLDTDDLLTPGTPVVESTGTGELGTRPLFAGAIEPVLEVRNSAGAVEAVCLSRDGNLLAVALADNTIRLFDLRAGTERFHVSGGASGAHTGAVVCGNPYLAGGNADGTITVWNALNGAKMLSLAGHSGAVDALALAPDESLLASGGADGTVRLWDPGTGKALAVLYGHGAGVVSLAISADGQSILSGGADGKAILWSRAGKRASAVLGGHSGKVIAVGFDDAGRPLTAEDTGLMRVWPKDGAGQPRVFAGSANPPAAEVAPGGHYVALGGSGGQASLYDTASGRLARGFAGPAGSAQFVLVDTAHQRLLTGGTDGMIRIWGLSDGADMARMISTLKGWAVLDQQGRFDGSQQGVDDVSWVAAANLPIDNFSEKYYEPGLLAKVFAERPVYVADAAAPLSAGVFPTPKSTLALSAGPYKAGQEIEITVTATDRGGGIAAQHLFHNGKLVPPDRLVSDTLDQPKDPKLRTSVYRSVLLAGANGFEAVSTSKQGVDGDAATAQIATVGTSAPPTLHVVTIGINTYYDARLDLDYGAPDALSMLAALARTGTAGFAKVEEHRLTNEQATKANILGLLKSLRTTKPEDEVVIYYAGHGEIVGKAWYMLPYDASLASEAEEVKGAISANDLRDAVVDIGANQILLFIDACKSGGSVATLTGALDRKVLRQVARDSGVAVIAASRPDQVAAELPTLGHGAFTYVMLEGLAGQADRDPGDGRITVSKLLKYSLETLPVVTEKLGTQPQVPVGYRRGTDFLIKMDVGSTSSNQ